MFLGSCLVLFVSLRSYGHLDDKLEFIENGVCMCLLNVFDVGGFTGLIRGRVLTIFFWAFSHLLLIGISIKIVLALVASFQQTWFRRIRSPNAEVVVVLVF